MNRRIAIISCFGWGKNAASGQGGYTIVELSLFLAVSGLLVLIAFIGTGSTIQATRFTDSNRSLHAYLQKQYDNILNGVNTRVGDEACSGGVVDTGGSQQAGTSSCLLLGRLITLKTGSSTANSYMIVGTEPPNVDYNTSDEELIYDFQPTIIRNVGTDTFNIPWGASVSGSERQIDEAAVDAFAMIRSPRSTRVLTYVYEEPSTSYALAPLINPAVSANDNNFNTPTNQSNFCIRSADAFSNTAKFTMTGGQGQEAIRLAFDANAGDCNGS